MVDQSPVTAVFTFVAGSEGVWRIDGVLASKGETLAPAARLAVVDGEVADGTAARWMLRGLVDPAVSTNEAGDDALAANQEPLGRPEARCAALVAVRKSPTWWSLPDDERRALVAERSLRLTSGLDGLPAISRRLHHAHELNEPFDLLAWFEYACTDQDTFDELLTRLRASEEWSFVDREVEVRVTR